MQLHSRCVASDALPEQQLAASMPLTLVRCALAAAAAGTSGCEPTKRPGSNVTRTCQPFTRDATGHGTHTSGTIAALRNRRGVVGAAAEGAQLYA